MARAITEQTQQLVTDLNEERSRYQNLLTEHLRLEEKYDDLKEEIALSSVSSTLKTPGHQLCVVCRFSFLVLISDLSSLPCEEHFQARSQENRFYPQQQRIRVHLQLRVHRIGRRFPSQRSKQVDVKHIR